MKLRDFLQTWVLITALVMSCSAATSAGRTPQQQPGASAPEVAAIKKINEATNAAAKLDAAAEFIKKFPKSTKRLEVVNHVAGSIDNVADATQRVTLTEKALTIFTLPDESDELTRSLLDAYLSAGRAADAFRVAAAWLPKHPDEADAMRRLAITATNESIKGNNTFINQGRDYAMKAIAQLEANRPIPGIDAAAWTEYKTKFLPALYREAAILALRAGDKAAAKPSAEKAAALKSSDPMVYVLLSDIANEEYNQQVRKNQAMPAGPEKSADVMRILKILDNLIELYAQTVAMVEGDAKFAEAAKAIRGDLEHYYKYRHNSTDGLQALIDKYKRPAQ
jgi:hypothetical protein